MGTLFALKNLLKSGRLALRLVRDDRVPNYAKLIAALALLYAVSPLDLVPDWIPVFGQMDDFAVLAAAVTLFVRLCPPEIVEEHEMQLGLRPRGTIEGHARPMSQNEM